MVCAIARAILFVFFDPCKTALEGLQRAVTLTSICGSFQMKLKFVKSICCVVA